jgi:hypothetical protein
VWCECTGYAVELGATRLRPPALQKAARGPDA